VVVKSIFGEEPMTKRIMMVDDDPDVLNLYNLIFESNGYSVLKALDGFDALGQLDEVTPDLFILDVMMPHMDGIELCRELRARPETARTPVIILSAWNEKERVERAFEAGADDYVSKPFPPSSLLEKVRSML
jgi:DNA-binding response OmpR family regulator